MSAVSAPSGLPARRPARSTSLVALYRLLLRTQVSLFRLLGVGALGGLAIALGVLARWDDDPVQAAADAAASYGLGVVVPMATLWLGTSAIGDLVEDRLLVYVWLKPVSRRQLPAAAILATVTVIAPPVALSQAIAAFAAGAGELALPSAIATSLAVLAYAGVFVAAGLWFRRAVWLGLAFVLLWENVGAYASAGTARFTITGWARAIIETTEGVEVALGDRSTTAALVVLPAIAGAGWLAAAIRYRRADVD